MMRFFCCARGGGGSRGTGVGSSWVVVAEVEGTRVGSAWVVVAEEAVDKNPEDAS